MKKKAASSILKIILRNNKIKPKQTPIKTIFAALFKLSTSIILFCNLLAADGSQNRLRTASTQGIVALAAQGGVATLTERSDETFSVMQFSSADRE